MATKRDRQAVVAEKTLAEKERVLKIMREADIYTRTLDPLIENYLDVFEIYQTMFLEWKGKGFPATQRHTNQAGATNTSKHPLAQLVETWSDKRAKHLDMLGLSQKAAKKGSSFVTGGSKVNSDNIMTKPPEVVDELAAHRTKWRDKA